MPYKLTNDQKPLLVYLPGMDGSGKLFHNQLSLETFFRVRCLSFGDDIVDDWDFFVFKLINFLHKEFNAHGDDPIYLCGESFGGCVALKLVEKIPQFFHKVILINPASSFSRRSWLNWGSYITRIMPDFVYNSSTLLLLPFLAKLDAIALPQRLTLLEALQCLSPLTVSNRITLLNKFSCNIEKLKSFSAPVLLVASAEDRLLPSVEEVERLATFFPNAFVSILAHSGHCCLLERDVNLVEILAKHYFLK